jgi:hypothetical protein
MVPGREAKGKHSLVGQQRVATCDCGEIIGGSRDWGKIPHPPPPVRMKQWHISVSPHRHGVS